VVVARRVVGWLVGDGSETVQGIDEGKIEGTESLLLSKVYAKLHSPPHTEHNTTL